VRTKIKKELVLEIIGEGGGWNVFRLKNQDGSIRFSQEKDGGSIFDADDLDMSEKEFKAFMKKLNAPVYFESFESFWKDFTKHGLKYFLYHRNIHPDYLEIIHNAFIEERKTISDDELSRFNRIYKDTFESSNR
jgi:hypothetical protein